MIIHGYFEEYTFQYSSGRCRLFVCVLRAGPGLNTSGRARAENSGPLRPLVLISLALCSVSKPEKENIREIIDNFMQQYLQSCENTAIECLLENLTNCLPHTHEQQKHPVYLIHHIIILSSLTLYYLR